MTLKTPYPD